MQRNTYRLQVFVLFDQLVNKIIMLGKGGDVTGKGARTG